MPACLNVRFHDPPSAIGPLLNAPSFAVTVCARSSSLRNVTDPPAAIVTVAGLNAWPAIDTEGTKQMRDLSTSRLRSSLQQRSARDTACRRRRVRPGRCMCRATSAASSTTGPARDCGSRIRPARTVIACGAARRRRLRSGSSRRREPSLGRRKVISDPDRNGCRGGNDGRNETGCDKRHQRCEDQVTGNVRQAEISRGMGSTPI